MRLPPRWVIAAAVFGSAAPLFSPVHAGGTFHTASLRPVDGDSPQAQARSRELIVQFRADTDAQDVARLTREAGAARVRRSAFGNRYRLTLDDGFTPAEALSRLAQAPEVEYAEPNGRMHALFTPNDPAYSVQWNFKMINAERTWDIQKGDPSVVVAIVDTGIAYENFGPYAMAPDFAGTTFVPGFDFINNDAHANDDSFHGTHVAGTVAESTNNSLGVAGLAFGCALMPVKVLDSQGEGTFFDVSEGIDFAARNAQVKVINLSLGGDSTSQAVTNSVNNAVSAGKTVVAAAGNDSKGTLSFPASLPNVIAVGAIDGRKQRAFYSNFGPGLSVVAPGGDLRRDDTGPGGVPDGEPDGILQQTFDPSSAERGIYNDFHLFFVTGTSQATPHVSAVAALLYRQGITDPVAIRAAIESTAEDLGAAGRDDTFGHGLVNPALALKGLGLNLP